MQKIKHYLPLAIKYLIYLTALTPIIFTNKIFYPFIFGKTIFFRSLIEIALLFFLVQLIVKLFNSEEEFRIEISIFKNRLFILFGFLLISAILSTIFAVDKYTAFWGTAERGGGLFGFFHYFIFLGLIILFFKKNDWLNFFKISSVVGLVVIFYGLLQYFNVKEFPFSLEGANRPGSFIGNPSFLSAYLFFVIACAVLTFSSVKNLFWRVFSVFLSLSSVFMLFLAATRGALLGLAVGVIVFLLYSALFLKGSKKIRNLSIFILAVFILLLSVFWFTRFEAFWRGVPGFNRFAGVSSFIPQDGSVQTRLVTWRMSWEAFKAKPILGWGPDNYLVAWDKYYNFKLATYGDTWLDRAHNQLLDVLVMQGVLGFLIYLVLFGFIFSLIFIRKKLGLLSPILGAILIAYFIQNIFLFDEISSYFLFVAIIGFLISVMSESNVDQEQKKVLGGQIKLIKKYTVSILYGILSLFILFSLYFYNYIPYRQGKDIQLARGGQKDAVRAQLIKSFYPYNFVQPSIRGYITDFYYHSQSHIFENDDFKILADVILDSIQEVIAHGSLDPRFYIRQSQILDVMGGRDPELYKKSEEAIRRAIELVPNRQELQFNLALSFAKQNRFDEALAIARRVRESNESVGRAHFFLGFLMSAENLGKNRVEILEELDTANKIDPALVSFEILDVSKAAEIYLKLQEYDKLADFVMKKINGSTTKIFEPQYYEFLLKYYLSKRDSGNFIKVADFIGREIPTQKENMDGLADLAQKGLWQVLENLP